MGFNVTTQNYSKAAQQGYTFDLVLPDGSVSNAKLTVIGDMSPEVQNHTKKFVREYSLKTAKMTKQGKEYIPDPDESIDYEVKSALVRLVGWEGFTDGEGKSEKPVVFSKEKAEEILREHTWMCPQIMEASKEVSNFTPKKTSTT